MIHSPIAFICVVIGSYGLAVFGIWLLYRFARLKVHAIALETMLNYVIDTIVGLACTCEPNALAHSSDCEAGRLYAEFKALVSMSVTTRKAGATSETIQAARGSHGKP